jgi:hypothetical protein
MASATQVPITARMKVETVRRCMFAVKVWRLLGVFEDLRVCFQVCCSRDWDTGCPGSYRLPNQYPASYAFD